MTDKLTIIKELKNTLQVELNGSVRDIILFGSQASGKASEESDYDVLIVLNKDYDTKTENRIYDLCYEIDLKYDIIIDVHIISTKELTAKRGRQPLFISALQKGLYA